MTLYLKAYFKQIISFIFFLVTNTANAFIPWDEIHFKISDKEVFFRKNKTWHFNELA